MCIHVFVLMRLMDDEVNRLFKDLNIIYKLNIPDLSYILRLLNY